MSPRVAQARAPGKLILAGEHAVVHGHPAIAIAVNRGTSVTLHEQSGPTRLGRSTVRDARVLPGLLTVLPEQGLRVDIDSDLPVGRGMGSSAALSVAVVRAYAALQGETLDFEETHERAFGPERHFHGNPSGVDHAVSALGGGVRYVKTPDGPVITPLSIPDLQLVVVDSGSAGDTGTLVAGVRSRRPAIDPQLDRIGALVDALDAGLKRGLPPESIGEILDENHSLLAAIGVSTPTLDAIVHTCRRAGAHGAKLAGAGGGGVVIALVDDPAPVLAAVSAGGWSAFSVGVAPSNR